MEHVFFTNCYLPKNFFEYIICLVTIFMPFYAFSLQSGSLRAPEPSEVFLPNTPLDYFLLGISI